MRRRRWTWPAGLIAAGILDAAARAGAQAAPEPAPAPVPELEIFGVAVPAGQRRQLDWRVSESFAGTARPVPIHVIHGRRPGRTLCLTGGIHGDELNGVEIVRRIAASLDPERVEDGGIMIARVEVGDRVQAGDVLATVTHPISSHSRMLRSPCSGRVIGRAVNQVVVPGFAAIHIGLAAPPEVMPAPQSGDEPGEPGDEIPAPETEERPE